MKMINVLNEMSKAKINNLPDYFIVKYVTNDGDTRYVSQMITSAKDYLTTKDKKRARPFEKQKQAVADEVSNGRFEKNLKRAWNAKSVEYVESNKEAFDRFHQG